MPILTRLVGALFALLPGLASASDSTRLCGQDAEPCLAYGAAVFQQRCALCHGSDGMGEGVLPLSVKDYPTANLLNPRVAKDTDALRRAIVEGPRFADMSPMMPPWGDELTFTQIESVTMFVAFLRQDPEAAHRMTRAEAERMPPSARLGRAVYAGRCTLCHGADAAGNGRMAARLTPRPTDLTRSDMPGEYLKAIIAKGGAALGRSPSMPTWEADLTSTEIDSLVLFIDTLRPPPGKGR